MGERIGSGGMADVYEAVDTRLGRPVAVKVFRPGPGPQTEERLTAEAVLLARLQHPGLVTVYDSGRQDGRTYLVMQLVEGPTLHSVLESGPLPEGRVAALGAGLARALAHVHRADIVHRDVKPSNVLLDSAGEPHLADFGIALLADATRQTAPDVLTGTAAYLAPEQVEGGCVGPAADVYALGLVLLECLKGELEYPGTPLEAAVARLLRAPELPAWLSPELAALLRTMTAKDPGARPDAEQCAQTLAALTAHSAPRPLPLTAPSAAHATGGAATRPARTEELRTAAAARPGHADAPAATGRQPARAADGRRHSRRLAVGTALAALSVTLGTAFSMSPGAGGTGEDRADATSTATAPDHPASGKHGKAGTAIPGGKPSTAPPAAPRPASRPVGSTPARPTPGTSGRPTPAASHAQPASRTLPSPSRTATTPDASPDTSSAAPPPQSPSAHHPGTTSHPSHANPSAPGQTKQPSESTSPEEE
ncbi:protein kinase domain-containing protein [Streptomyces sp. DSM 118148]|uniref:protein kinase domain-containing protein n=1 Tax=Streptomyces sp. DSM 118148 TaxID=3448667 RepID=UPI00403FFE18